MSDDRDIDDILESLDQLLRSGNHHNDDHTDHTPPPLSGRKTENVPEARHEAAEEKLFEVRDPTFDLPLGEEISLDDIPGVEVAEPEVAEPEVAGGEVPAATQRVVLTEDMLIDNPQGKLSLRIVEGDSGQDEPEVADDAENVAEAAEQAAAESIHVDHAHLEQLMAQVSDDVIAQLQQALPQMIRQSLYRHLNELRQEGDVPDADPK